MRPRLILTLVLSAIQLAISVGAAPSGTRLNPNGGESYQQGQHPSCPELDDRLATLTPRTYAKTPEFYADGLRGTAVWTGTLWSPAWAYLGYSELRDEYRRGRIADVRAEMERLRRLKARQHCYE